MEEKANRSYFEGLGGFFSYFMRRSWMVFVYMDSVCYLSLKNQQENKHCGKAKEVGYWKLMNNRRPYKTKLGNLNKATKSFKQALQKTMKSFPRGACKPASILLAKYLVTTGVVPENLVFLSADGTTEDSVKHTYLLVDDLILDITISQYDTSISKVLFNKDSKLHTRFKRPKLYEYSSFISNISPEHEKVFSETLRRLKK